MLCRVAIFTHKRMLTQDHCLVHANGSLPACGGGLGRGSLATNLYPQVLSRHRPGKQQPIWVLRPGYCFVILGRLSGHEGDGTEICDDGRDVAPSPSCPYQSGQNESAVHTHLNPASHHVRANSSLPACGGGLGRGSLATNLYPQVRSRHRPGTQRPIWVLRLGYCFVILGRLSGHEGDGTEICDDGRDVAPSPSCPYQSGQNESAVHTHLNPASHHVRANSSLPACGGGLGRGSLATNLYPQVRSRHRPGRQRPIWVLRPGYCFVILGRLSGHEGDGTEICDDGRDVAPIPLVPVPWG